MHIMQSLGLVILPLLCPPILGLSPTKMLHKTPLDGAQFSRVSETGSLTSTACVSECLKYSTADLCKVFAYDETRKVCTFGTIDVDADAAGTMISVYQEFGLSGKETFQCPIC